MLYLLNVLYLASIANAIEVYQGTGSESNECAPAPERTSKTWKPTLDVEQSGLNLATGGEPQLTLMVVMDTMYFNDTYVADDTYAFDWFSPRFSYPDFCGVNVPQNIATFDYSHAPGDTSLICETSFEVNMEYVKYCNFDVTDDEESYKFSGHMLSEVKFRQTFLGDYVFQKFSRPIGFVVELPKILTVTTDITVINPDQCATSDDCNGQTCEDADTSDSSTPKICKCDECHEGNFCEVDICAPQLECPANVEIDACSLSGGLILDADENPIRLLDQLAKASDTLAASGNPVVGTAAGSLTWSRTLGSTASSITGTYSTVTENSIEYAHLTDDIDAQDGLWTYPTETVVTYCVKDEADLETCCTFNVKVLDVCSARITCETDVVETNNIAVINNAVFLGTADDNGLSQYSVTRTTAESSSLNDGQVTIEFCVQDTSNGVDLNDPVCCSEPYYYDQTPPVITCADLTLETADYTNFSPSTELPQPTTSDAGVGLQAGSLTENALVTDYPTRTNEWKNTRVGNVVGGSVNVFTFSVQDKVGNSNSCTSTVTVTDPLDPKITCTDAVIDDSNQGNYDADNLFTTADNDAIKDQTSFAVKEYTWGSTTETIEVSDFHNSPAVTLDCTVTRKDTTDPTIDCPSSVHKVNMDTNQNSADVSSYVASILATAQDNQAVDTTATTVTVDGVLTTSYVLTPTVDDQVFTFVATVFDTQVLSYPVNSKVCTFTVEVNDNQNPSLLCPYASGLEVETDAGESCGTPNTFNGLSGTDNAWYDATTEAYDQSPTTCYAFANSPYTVTGSVSDKALNPANSNTCSFVITVVDRELPVLTCTDVTSTLDQGELYSTTVSYVAPTMSDNVAVDTSSLSYSDAASTQFPVGTTTVTATVKDTSNNEGYCTFTVTVTHSCGDGTIAPSGEECDGSTGCAADCTCETPTYKASTGGGCEVDCEFGYLNDGTCKVDEDCDLEINTAFYSNTVAPTVIQCDYTDYGNNCNIDTNNWNLGLVESTSLDELQVIDMWVEWYPYGDQASTTGSDQEITGGEYAEVKICCLDRPAHPLEVLVFNDIDNEATYVDSVADCIAKGYTSAAIRPVWAGVGTPAEDSLDQEGCFYVPVCSGGVVVIGEKYNDPVLECNSNQASIEVELTTLVSGSNDCAAVTAPTDFSSRYTVQADTNGWTVPSSEITAALTTTNGDCAATTGFDWTVGTHPVQFSVTYPSGTTTDGQTYAGATSYCTFNVVVTDKYDPTFLSCPENIAVSYTSGTDEATFTPDALKFRDETDPTADTDAPAPVVTSSDGSTLTANNDGSYTITAGATITWTVSDTAENAATCVQQISLSDSEGPVMTCANAIYTADVNTNTAQAALPSITCLDAVSGDCTQGAIDSVSVYAMTGASSVTYDIRDDIPARYVDDTNPHFDTDPSANYMYSYTATGTDAAGNPSTCTGYITIDSDQAPDVTCPSSSTVSLTGTDFSYQVVPQDFQFTTSDNDDGTIVLTKPGSQTLSCKGTASANFLATVTERLHWPAKTKLTDTCQYTISVEDDAPPSIVCPTTTPEVLVECPTSGCSTDADWNKASADTSDSFFAGMITDATITDNCDNSVTTTHNGASSYTIQDGHSVTLTATDDDTNAATAQCQFNVKDKIPPRNTVCPSDEAYVMSVVGSSYSYSVANHLSQMTWTDNVAVAQVSRVSVTDSQQNAVVIAEDNTFSPVAGEVYTFVYTAVDTSANTGSTCSWTMTVTDDVDPSISCPGDLTFEAEGSAVAYTYTAAEITTSDNYVANSALFFKWRVAGGTYTAEASVDSSGIIQLPAQNLPASYAILPSYHLFQVKVRDTYQNEIDCEWTVKIEDTTPPSIDCSSVSDIEVRPTSLSASVTVTYPTDLGFSVSDIHAEQSILDATVTLTPATGAQYFYSTTGSNSYPVNLNVVDTQTVENLDTDDANCFNVVILPPYPPAVIEAALKSVRITTDSAGDFFADVVFVTGINWPHTLYERTGVVGDDTSIAYTGAETRTDEMQVFDSRHSGALADHCASQYSSSDSGFGVGSSCFQDWELKIKFGSCDAVDMEITINFKSICDNEGPGLDDCILSANHAVVFTFAAEDYCTKQLSDVEIEGVMTTYASTGSVWTQFKNTDALGYDEDGHIVVLDDVPTADTTFDPAAQVVALVTVTSTQAIIKKLTILSLTRTECQDAELTDCAAPAALVTRADKDATPAYNVASTTDSYIKNNFAYGQYTEMSLNAGETAFVKLDCTVQIEYLLQAGGRRRRSVLELEMMEANYPDNIAHLMPRARRSMAQGSTLETSSQVAGNFVLDFGGATGGNNPRTSTGSAESGSDLPPYVVPAIITVLLVALCAACAVGCCCYYIGLKKRKDDKEFINDSFDGDQEGDIQTNIYLSPNVGPSSRV